MHVPETHSLCNAEPESAVAAAETGMSGADLAVGQETGLLIGAIGLGTETDIGAGDNLITFELVTLDKPDSVKHLCSCSPGVQCVLAGLLLVRDFHLQDTGLLRARAGHLHQLVCTCSLLV